MWAGYLALVNQQAVANGNSPLGFINPSIYAIGLSGAYDVDFHDITSGSNGYNATVGYDLATGWGSPNGSGLINSLAGGSGAPGFTLFSSPAAVTVAQGSSGTSSIISSVTGGFDSTVTLSAKGQPTGVTVTFNPTSLTGDGTSTMTMTVASSTVTGVYPITVTGTAGSTTETTTVTLTVTGPPNFSISASPNSVTILPGKTGTTTITTTIAGDFNSPITLSASGQGSGVTVSFSPSSIAAPGSGTSTMSIKVAKGAPLGTHAITVIGNGEGIKQTTKVSLTINN
jgi:hypothetical protein